MPPVSKKLEMRRKMQNRTTGVTVISQHLVNTIDYTCGSLLIHYMIDNTMMIELTHLVIIGATQIMCLTQLLCFIKIINDKS